MVISLGTHLQIRFLRRLECRKANRYRSKSVVLCSSEIEDSKVKSLDRYLEKLEAKRKESVEADTIANANASITTKEELDLLNLYLAKLSEDSNWEKCISSTSANVKSQSETSVFAARTFSKIKPSQPLETSDEILGLYITSSLASVNIAVFLFELASPVSNSTLYSLPLMYGAKINHLIEAGEWWRLVTPMFLHSGLLHVALGCWGLHTFAPHVCRRYGSFVLLLIYTLGGIFGNLSSYLLTSEATVGGTGPLFALIGAWLVVRREDEEPLFHKAVVATGLGLLLSHFGPIDDWYWVSQRSNRLDVVFYGFMCRNHLGAIMVGVAYGLFNGPMAQEDVDGTRAYLWKSVGVFSVFIMFYLAVVILVRPGSWVEPDVLF